MLCPNCKKAELEEVHIQSYNEDIGICPECGAIYKSPHKDMKKSHK